MSDDNNEGHATGPPSLDPAQLRALGRRRLFLARTGFRPREEDPDAVPVAGDAEASRRAAGTLLRGGTPADVLEDACEASRGQEHHQNLVPYMPPTLGAWSPDRSDFSPELDSVGSTLVISYLGAPCTAMQLAKSEVLHLKNLDLKLCVDWSSRRPEKYSWPPGPPGEVHADVWPPGGTTNMVGPQRCSFAELPLLKLGEWHCAASGVAGDILLVFHGNCVRRALQQGQPVYTVQERAWTALLKILRRSVAKTHAEWSISEPGKDVHLGTAAHRCLLAMRADAPDAMRGAARWVPLGAGAVSAFFRVLHAELEDVGDGSPLRASPPFLFVQAADLDTLHKLRHPLKTWKPDMEANMGQFRKEYDQSVTEACEALSLKLAAICAPTARWWHDAALLSDAGEGVLLAPTEQTAERMSKLFDYRLWPPAEELRKKLTLALQTSSSPRHFLSRAGRWRDRAGPILGVHRLRVFDHGRTACLAPSGDRVADTAYALAAGQVFDSGSGQTRGLCMAGAAGSYDGGDPQSDHVALIERARKMLSDKTLPEDWEGIPVPPEGRCVSRVKAYLPGGEYLAGVGEQLANCGLDLSPLLESAFLGAAILPPALQTGMTASSETLAKIGAWLRSVARLVALPIGVGSARVEWQCHSLQLLDGAAVVRSSCGNSYWDILASMAVVSRGDLTHHAHQLLGGWVRGAMGLHALAGLVRDGYTVQLPPPHLLHMAMDTAWLSNLGRALSGTTEDLAASGLGCLLDKSLVALTGHVDCRVWGKPEKGMMLEHLWDEAPAWDAVVAATVEAVDGFPTEVEHWLCVHHEHSYGQAALPLVLAELCNRASEPTHDGYSDALLSSLEAPNSNLGLELGLKDVVPHDSLEALEGRDLPELEQVLSWAKGDSAPTTTAQAALGAVLLCVAVANTRGLDLAIVGVATNAEEPVALRVGFAAGSAPWVLLLRLGGDGQRQPMATLFSKPRPVPCTRVFHRDEHGLLDPQKFEDRELELEGVMLTLIGACGRRGSEARCRGLLEVLRSLQKWRREGKQGAAVDLRKLVAKHVLNLLAVDTTDFLVKADLLPAAKARELCREHDTAWEAWTTWIGSPERGLDGCTNAESVDCALEAERVDLYEEVLTKLVLEHSDVDAPAFPALQSSAFLRMVRLVVSADGLTSLDMDTLRDELLQGRGVLPWANTSAEAGDGFGWGVDGGNRPREAYLLYKAVETYARRSQRPFAWSAPSSPRPASPALDSRSGLPLWVPEDSVLHCTAGPSGARYPTWAHWLAVSTLLRLEGPGLAARPRGPVTEDIFKGKKNKVHFSIGYKTRQLLLSIILHGIRSDPGLDCTVTEPSVILGMGLSVGYIFPAEDPRFRVLLNDGYNKQHNLAKHGNHLRAYKSLLHQLSLLPHQTQGFRGLLRRADDELRVVEAMKPTRVEHTAPEFTERFLRTELARFLRKQLLAPENRGKVPSFLAPPTTLSAIRKEWMVTAEVWPHLAALVGPQAGGTAPDGRGLLHPDQLCFELSLDVPPQVEE